MAINKDNLETVLTDKINAADTNTDNKDLLLLSKSVEALGKEGLSTDSIGVTVQPFDSTILTSSDTNDIVGLATAAVASSGAYESADTTILKDADIGTTVQGFDADTVKAPSNTLPALDGSALTGIDSLPAQSSATADYHLVSDGSNAAWLEAGGGGGGAFAAPLATGTIYLAEHDAAWDGINWTNTNTNTYGWLIQRTNGMSGGKHQFALVQGGQRDQGCRGTILPFQIGSEAEGYAYTAGTPAIMWTNSSSQSDFSTCSIITDDKSGKYHYSGNIPWPGSSGHIMGYGHGELNSNNTASNFWDSGTDIYSGIHNHNGHFRGVTNSASTGWKGCHSGYANGDSKTRIHSLNFDSGMSTSVQNPSANTSTSPSHVHHLQYNSELGNTALVGVTHFRNSSNDIIARVFDTGGGSTDHNSGQNWDVLYSSSNSPMVSLSIGKTIVWHGSRTYLYTSASSRTEITAAPPPFGTNANDAFAPSYVVPAHGEPDTWYSLGSNSSNVATLQKWSINPTTYVWTEILPTSTQILKVGWSSYQKLFPLTNHKHFLHMWRTNKGRAAWQVIDVSNQFPY